MTDPTAGPADDLLTLQQAADRLQVHYMTAYRWVRRGDLPAFKTGGRLRVRASDLGRFVEEREVDIALPSRSEAKTDWQRHVDRLTDHLLAGEGVEAGALARKVVADGAAAGDVYVRLIAPALHRVGEEWAAGRVNIVIEHRATEIAVALMARLGDHFRRRGPSRGTAVTLAPSGDLHGLASTMVADFLRAAGYDVHHLGANVPAEDLALFLEVVPTHVLAVSMTNPETDPATLPALVAAAREHGDAVVVVGGQAAVRGDVEAAGAVYVDDLLSLAAAVTPDTPDAEGASDEDPDDAAGR